MSPQNMRDQAFMTLMRLLPKSLLSHAVGVATRLPAPKPVHQAAMRAFARSYAIDMDEAEQGFEGYGTFAEFFTRRLKPGLRPIDASPNGVSSPVDGAVSQIGEVTGGECIQAKGIRFPVAKLLGDEDEARAFDGGSFATLYLAPRDYHRIHSPLDGRITGYRYLPGEFWPVNRISVRTKDALFCLNERLVTHLETPAGKVAVVAVGATCVSRIHASYDAIVTHQGQPMKAHRYPESLPIRKGDELGMFEMGSTVVLVFERGRVKWDPSLGQESVVRVGARLGEFS